MKNLYKIGVLLAAIILSGSTISWAGTGALHDTAKLQQAQQESSASTRPESKAFLFSVQHPAESGVNFLEQLPKPHTAENPQHFRRAQAALGIQLYVRGCFYLCRAAYHTHTVRKLIFPFHSHW